MRAVFSIAIGSVRIVLFIYYSMLETIRAASLIERTWALKDPEMGGTTWPEYPVIVDLDGVTYF